MTDIALISNNKKSFLEIVKVGKIDISLTQTASNPGAGNFVEVETIVSQAHGLNFTPLIIGFEDQSAPPNLASFNLMVISMFGLSSPTQSQSNSEIYCDNTNVYYIEKVMAEGEAINNSIIAPTFAHYYLLRERTN